MKLPEVPAFVTAILPLAQANGIDPKGAVAVLLRESNLMANALNRQSAAAGINQFLPSNYGEFSPLTVSQYLALSATDQLPYTFKFWKSLIANPKFGKGQTQWDGADLYWLNWIPAYFKPGVPDSYVISKPGDSFYQPGLAGSDGNITLEDLWTQLDTATSRQQALWTAISNEIDVQTGVSQTAPSSLAKLFLIGAGGIALGMAGAMVYEQRKRMVPRRRAA